MSGRRYVFLTGATGLLGRYLLRDLTHFRVPLAVLVRDSAADSAADRVENLVAFWEDSLKARLPRPVVITGDLLEAGVGLTGGDRSWLASHCGRILHAAADVSFTRRDGSGPWAANVGGTRRLLALAGRTGIDEFHHISTAFVCGDRPGPVAEDDHGRRAFRNVYERSKWAAELAVRSTGVQATFYRPSVIVGDSRTGYTSTYHGPYRFLEAAARLAGRSGAGRARRRLALRLPFTGDEPRNLVPVNWVAQSIARIVRRPALAGRTYHLVARSPTRVADLEPVIDFEILPAGR
jgi:thioester reductase-like protein